MTRTIIGKFDYEGDEARIEGDSVPTRKMIAKVAAFLKARPLKGKNVVAQIIEEGDKAGWIEHVQELPLDQKKPAAEPTKEELDRSREEYNATAAKMAKAGFGQPTPGPAPDTHKEVPAARAPDELFTDAEVAAMKAKADAAMAAKGKETEKVDGIAKICADTKARNAAHGGEISCTFPSHSAVEVVPETRLLPMHTTPKNYSEDEMLLLRNVIAKGCSEPEFKLLMYMANTYGLDPLLKQIWAVKRNESAPALIFAGRDGMLAIAHRSGHFDGMQSAVVYEGEGKDRKPVSAWCEIWRNDMTHSFKAEVPFSEYNTGYSVWKTNPSAMILKVAESGCLRKAFSVSGLYSPEEIDTERST
jgi:phage recombination protein Bet